MISFDHACLLLKRLVRQKLQTVIGRRQRAGVDVGHSAYLRESIRYADIGTAGPLITDVFSGIKDVPGWFTVDDCGYFFLLLSLQSAMGIKGDLLEIGTYHGRSAALMTKCLQPGERIVVCDAFELSTVDKYPSKPSPEQLISNIERVNRSIERDRIVIHKCLSGDLQLDTEEQFRFIHIDGGHSAEQAYSDLQLCSKHVFPNGIIVMDDYQNNQWPEVTQGTDKFLNDSDVLRVLADINRHGCHGRKLYLIRAK